MAVTTDMLKDKYRDLPVDKLKDMYEDIKKCYCFNTKEEQIELIMNTYLSSSFPINTASSRKAIEELLKEKTGSAYTIVPKRFVLTNKDIIDYIINPKIDPFWNILLTNFFQKITNVKETDKTKFIIELYQDKSLFNKFTKDIIKTDNANEIYNTYKELANKYCRDNLAMD